MDFNDHWRLEGKHAFLSPSQYHWVNYSPEKLEERYYNSEATKRGTELHAYAAAAIKLNRRQPKTKNSDSVSMFINDAIGYSMTPEQPLYYSDYCFGTADAISFWKNKLRIHDLKTGVVPASMMQLYVYAALFCLEYKYKPEDIEIELRIYQSNECITETPDPSDISDVMNKIIDFTAILEKLDA